MKRILLLGGYGGFGGRIAHRLAGTEPLQGSRTPRQLLAARCNVRGPGVVMPKADANSPQRKLPSLHDVLDSFTAKFRELGDDVGRNAREMPGDASENGDT